MEITRQTAVASFVVVPLIDAATRPSYKASPTLAAGDVKIIRHTGGVWNVANIGTLPAIVDAGATKQILVTLTATELTSDNLDYPIIIQFIDQTATKEWDDQEIIIWTKAISANLTQILGTVLTETAGYLAAAFKKFFNVNAPTGTVNSIPDAIAGANGGLPTTNGTKINQTVDLTAGQSIACNDKTGFSLAATGLDLVTAASTFGVAIIAGIWDALTSGMVTVGSIGKKLADWVIGTITANQAVNVAQWGGSNIATPAINGEPVVTLDAIQAAYTPAKAGDAMIISGTKQTLDALNDVSAATVNSEVDTALADIDLDHLSKTGSAPTPTIGSNLDKVMNKNSSQTFSQSTDALEAIADSASAGLTAQEVRNAMSLAPTGGDPESGSIDDELYDIKAQTDLMNFTGDNIDANVEAIDTNANAAAKLAASANTESLCTIDTSRPFAPTTTEFETDSTVLAQDRWVIFRSGTLIGQAKPITVCEPISGKTHITTEAFTAAPSNGDTFVIV
jgi:hypothetical protein